jgi:hypothetical protein
MASQPVPHPCDRIRFTGICSDLSCALSGFRNKFRLLCAGVLLRGRVLTCQKLHASPIIRQ